MELKHLLFQDDVEVGIRIFAEEVFDVWVILFQVE
jgi:hypothetical protein